MEHFPFSTLSGKRQYQPDSFSYDNIPCSWLSEHSSFLPQQACVIGTNSFHSQIRSGSHIRNILPDHNGEQCIKMGNLRLSQSKSSPASPNSLQELTKPREFYNFTHTPHPGYLPIQHTDKGNVGNSRGCQRSFSQNWFTIQVSKATQLSKG